MKKEKEVGIEFNKDCSIRKALGIIGQKHSILIFNELLKHQVLRFGELRKVLGNLNTGTLTVTLKQLEKSGLIRRKVYSEIPPRVEYSLTDKGKELERVLLQLQDWYETWYV
ncbi:MAG: helix-turn-helix transcriptional regulator [Candidatus Nomurabacteria bacterium]|nr:MAG: helix-turn-helix transcriptional regulator [Candidatus Nomurabacteria bacterium]